MITRTFKLCLNAGTGSAPFINVSQTDKDEVWLFELYTETGERYIPSSGAIIGIKADGHGIANTGTVDSEGRVVITETEQMTAAAGRSIFELSIDGLTHGTANFIVNVEKKPIDGAIMSDSDLSLISQAVDSAAVIVDVIGDGDPSEVIGEHVDAWLDAHPEATTTVQDGAITAPKINQSLWDKLLVSEEASGNPASFDDGADDVPVSSLKVALEPVQLGSGDPSPSNIRPIYPANNRNQFPTTADGTYTYAGVTVVANNGVYTVTGTATATSYIELSLATSVDLSPATNQFAFLNSVTDGNIEFAVYRDSTRVHYWAMAPQNRVTANWPDTGNEVVNKIRFNFQSGKTYNITISPVLCLATYPTPTAFTPYQGIMVDVAGANMYDANTNTLSKALSSNGNLLTSSASFTTDYIPVGGSLFVSYGYETLAATANRILGFYDADKVWIANASISYAPTSKTHSFTVPSGAVYARMTLDNSVTNIVISSEHYSCPMSLGQSVYGGSVDLATGVLTVTHKLGVVDTNTYQSAQLEGGTTHLYRVNCNNSPFAGKVGGYPTDCKCNYYGTVGTSYANMSSNSTDMAFAISGTLGTTLLISDSTITSVDVIPSRIAQTPIQVWFPLATPQTIQLTPTEVKTLLGYNNISSTGTVDVIYHADTKLYVDKMTNVDNAIIAPTEADFVATRNYTVNDLVIVNDTLYKCTANIASGSTITPNSNVTVTTLGALIKALS